MATHIRKSDLPAALASSADFGCDQRVTRRGVTVRLHGLVAGAAYNGALGVVNACRDEKEERERCAGGRQPVLLRGSGKKLSVRPDNLAVVGAPLSADFVALVRQDLATGLVPMPINREYFSQMMAAVRHPEHACTLDVVCRRCATRQAPLYLVLKDLLGPQCLGVECTDCTVLIAAEEGVPAEMPAITAFNDRRYRGVYSAIMALQGDATGGFHMNAVHPPGLPGPLYPGVSEQYHDY